VQLRGELYVQVMKQLRGNESWSSREAGWALMALLLSCFPPPATLENYLAVRPMITIIYYYIESYYIIKILLLSILF
jgi:hypothetical protein